MKQISNIIQYMNLILDVSRSFNKLYRKYNAWEESTMCEIWKCEKGTLLKYICHETGGPIYEIVFCQHKITTY